jgi:hypothetical protein
MFLPESIHPFYLRCLAIEKGNLLAARVIIEHGALIESLNHWDAFSRRHPTWDSIYKHDTIGPCFVRAAVLELVRTHEFDLYRALLDVGVHKGVPDGPLSIIQAFSGTPQEELKSENGANSPTTMSGIHRLLTTHYSGMTQDSSGDEGEGDEGDDEEPTLFGLLDDLETLMLEIVADPVQLAATNTRGHTLLYCAISEGHLQAARILVCSESKLKPEERNELIREPCTRKFILHWLGTILCFSETIGMQQELTERLGLPGPLVLIIAEYFVCTYEGDDATWAKLTQVTSLRLHLEQP